MRGISRRVGHTIARLAIVTLLSPIACKSDRHVSRGSEGSAAAQSIGVGDTEGMTDEHTNAVMGSVKGIHVTNTVTSFVVEGDVPDGRTIVYLFSSAVTCVDLSFANWNERIPEGTAVIALEFLRARLGELAVLNADVQTTDAAAARFTRALREKAWKELSADRGTLTLRALAPDGAVAGSFSVWFGHDHLIGDFNAAFCPLGHEP